MPGTKLRAPQNRTLTVSPEECEILKDKLIRLEKKAEPEEIINRIINQNTEEVTGFLPDSFADLLFLDPPYNLDKSFNSISFRAKQQIEYENWIESWLSKIIHTLKPDASIYFCCDWSSSNAVYNVVSKYFIVRNRITWEREKGRGALKNWKNCSEDIWFCTVSDKYKFNPDAVKLKRKVLAPYRNSDRSAKDWENENNGNFRLTFPSNIWTDISVPFWSMPENTDHPTQKPEKLLAKIILASTEENDLVLDPFLGSGSSAVTAKKLGRNFVGIELDELYCCFAMKRLINADENKAIQGYDSGVFWERNTLEEQLKIKKQEKR